MIKKTKVTLYINPETLIALKNIQLKILKKHQKHVSMGDILDALIAALPEDFDVSFE